MLRRLLFHNFQFFYRLDRWVKRRFTSAGMLFAGTLVAAAVFGIDTRRTLAYQMATFLLVLLAIALISALFFRANIKAVRRLPRFATVGETLSYPVALKNHSNSEQRGLHLVEDLNIRIPSFQQFRDAREPGAERRNWFDRYVGYPRWTWLVNRSRGALVTGVSLPDIRPDGEVEVELMLRPVRRGYIRFSGFSLSRLDPFGLFRAMVSLQQKEALLVLPRRYPVPPLDLGAGRHYQRGGVSLASAIGDSQEFMALREYRPGDPSRHIHWRSWARLGEPVVKEFQDEFFVRQALVLDTFVSTHGDDRFEEAVSLAASFVSNLTSPESLLDLAFVGTERYYFTAGRGVSQVEGLLEVLACVDACTDKSFGALRELVMEHADQISGCVCVLLDWEVERRGLVEMLQALGIPVRVFLVADGESKHGLDSAPMKHPPERFHVLQTGMIREGLATLQ